jgi:thermitase
MRLHALGAADRSKTWLFKDAQMENAFRTNAVCQLVGSTLGNLFEFCYQFSENRIGKNGLSRTHVTQTCRYALLILINLLGIIGGQLFFGRPLIAAPTAESDAGAETILVHFAAGATESERLTMIASIQGELVRWLPQINVAEVRLSPPTAIETINKSNPADVALQRLHATGRNRTIAQYIENNVTVEGAYTPNDPDVANQQRTYPLEVTHAIEGWDYTRGSVEIIIAVLDSGIAATHPEFDNRILPGYDVVNRDNDPTDDHGHGTHAAGIIAAGIDNHVGMVGICPGCTILPVKVLNENNAGTWSGVAEGILYATDQGARVINLSLGASVSSKTLENAVNYAIAHDVLIVAAAGNMGVERKFYPAALEGVMAVSATDATDQRWVLSNIGDYIDVAAPGHAVYSTFNDLNNYYGGYNYMSGTSMAAPHVAGLAGLLLSQKPDRSAEDLYQIITTTADKLNQVNCDSYIGFGRINIARALAADHDNQWITVPLGEETTGASEPQLQYLYFPLVTKL